MRLPCGFLCSLCSVSSAVRDRGEGTAETPEDPKLTPVGEKSPGGRECPDTDPHPMGFQEGP